MSKNKFNHFPNEITFLPSLKTLIFNRNNLDSIPDEISNLQLLEKLDLWSNEIEYVTNKISNLEQLKELDLRVIQFSDNEQKRIHSLLPNCKIYFSNACNCGY